MKSFKILSRQKAVLVVALACLMAIHPSAYAESPVKLIKWSGEIDTEAQEAIPFTLAGNASHLGKFSAYGEVDFTPGPDDDSMLGVGVVVFTAANGDLLVGNVTWDVGPEDDGARPSKLHFVWADAVRFSDGTVVGNTGRFIDSRPPGLVVIAIIAILIGLLLPAVQKVR